MIFPRASLPAGHAPAPVRSGQTASLLRCGRWAFPLTFEDDMNPNNTPHPDQSRILRGNRVLVVLPDGATETFCAAEDATGEVVKSWRQSHPRSACTRLLPTCPQCGAEMPAPVTRRIRENRQWVDRVFCSDRCGGHYQMGCEG